MLRLLMICTLEQKEIRCISLARIFDLQLKLKSRFWNIYKTKHIFLICSSDWNFAHVTRGCISNRFRSCPITSHFHVHFHSSANSRMPADRWRYMKFQRCKFASAHDNETNRLYETFQHIHANLAQINWLNRLSGNFHSGILSSPVFITRLQFT